MIDPTPLPQTEASSFMSRFWPTTEEALDAGVQASEVETYKRYAYQQAFGLQSWYEALRDHTYETWFVELDAAETSALHRAASAGRIEGERQALASAQARVDEALALAGPSAFVKLNTRSPKDVVMGADGDPAVVDVVLGRVRERLRGAQPSQQHEELDATSLLMSAFVAATTEELRVADGAGALALLARSQRVRQDLAKVVSFGTSGAARASISVRRWCDEVARHPEGEFRGFVWQGALNAVSQYDDVTFYPQLAQRRAELGGRLLAFFDEHVRAPLAACGHDDFVIDFFVHPRTDEVKVIELNPFHTGAGPHSKTPSRAPSLGTRLTFLALLLAYS